MDPLEEIIEINTYIEFAPSLSNAVIHRTWKIIKSCCRLIFNSWQHYNNQQELQLHGTWRDRVITYTIHIFFKYQKADVNTTILIQQYTKATILQYTNTHAALLNPRSFQ